jgi:hypothetical protein
MMTEETRPNRGTDESTSRTQADSEELELEKEGERELQKTGMYCLYGRSCCKKEKPGQTEELCSTRYLGKYLT